MHMTRKLEDYRITTKPTLLPIGARRTAYEDSDKEITLCSAERSFSNNRVEQFASRFSI